MKRLAFTFGHAQFETSKKRYKSPLINHSMSLSLSFLNHQTRVNCLSCPTGLSFYRNMGNAGNKEMHVQALYNLQTVLDVGGFLVSLQPHLFSKYVSGIDCVPGTVAGARVRCFYNKLNK